MNGQWICRHQSVTPQIQAKKKERTWTFHPQLLEEDSFCPFRIVCSDGRKFEFVLGEPSSLDEFAASSENLEWKRHIPEKFRQFLQTPKGKFVLETLKSLQPFHSSNNLSFCDWFPLLIAITNKAKHVEQLVPWLDDIRDAQHPDDLLFFQVEDSAFYYHSFLSSATASDQKGRLQSSIELLRALKGSLDVNTTYSAFLNQDGYATDHLLDQTRDSLNKKLSNTLSRLSGQFKWDEVIDRIWRHRNFAMKKCSPIQHGDGLIRSTDFQEFVLNALPEKSKIASEELFQALSSTQKKPILFCENMVPLGCELKKAILRSKWGDFMKGGNSKAFPPLSDVTPYQRLEKDFVEEKVLDFLKSKQKEARVSRRVQDELLPIPRKVLVLPFLQILLDEVTRIISPTNESN